MQCPLRHLVDCHPERVALLYREKLLSDEEAESLREIAGGDLFSSKLNDAILAALGKE